MISFIETIQGEGPIIQRVHYYNGDHKDFAFPFDEDDFDVLYMGLMFNELETQFRDALKIIDAGF